MAAAVLVVGPGPSDWANLGLVLSGQGYEVITARTGKAALLLCPSLQPDLVLINDPLPDTHGLDLCRQLKSDPRNRLTPVVLVSEADNASFASRAFEAGADDFWGYAPASQEALHRVQALIQLKAHIDENAESVIFSLAHSVEARDSFDGGHGARVSGHAVRFGRSLGLSHGDLETLRIGGLIHDIGKIGIPDAILSKPGPLDPEEARIVEQHPVVGEKICAPLKSFHRVLPLIRHHHERMNGTGYPDGLRGDQIPLLVRILQIADICDALTSDRSYRQTLSLPNALVILYDEAERGWLDETLVRQFAPIAGRVEKPVMRGIDGAIGQIEGAKRSATPTRALAHPRGA